MNNNINNMINADAFGESLITCAVQAQELCSYIDDKVKRLTATSFIPYVSAAEQYERVIDQIVMKAELIDLYKAFVEWTEYLSAKQKQIVKMYFVTCKHKTYKVTASGKYRQDKTILPVVRAFLRYLDVAGEFDAKSLINNKFVYNVYHNIMHRSKLTKKCPMVIRRGKKYNDNPTNER